MKKNRPAVLVQTVHFHARDRHVAKEIGEALYERLTRPLDDPLAHGGQILVFQAVAPEHVSLDAEETVLVPVFGSVALNTAREQIISTLKQWHAALGPGRVLAVPLAENGRGLESKVPVVNILSELYGENGRRRTIDDIVVATARLLKPDDGRNVQLFISHAKADLASTETAAVKISEHVFKDTRGEVFFDNRSLAVGDDLREQISSALGEGVLVVVRGDAYSSRPWCQEELLLAKRFGLPTLTVEILRKGEPRSLAYGGNGPSLVWGGDPAPVVSRALVEYVRAAAFRRRAKQVIENARLPADTTVLTRPPELLDLAQGPLNRFEGGVVVHPDPELPVVEREVLRLASPRLRLVTPTTSFRRVLRRPRQLEATSSDASVHPTEDLANPLDGLQIAMSLSSSPDIDGDEGYAEAHVRDATAYLSRSLISIGAAIAYGGDFRRNSYTEMLGRLLTAYNQTAAAPADLLHSYLGAPIALEDVPDDLELSIHHLDDNFADRALLPSPAAGEDHPVGLYFSDMRRVMAEETAARILLGGQATPRIESGGAGYGGRYPGVVEEAWWTLEKGKPLYVVGGYGGAAGVVADLLEDRPAPEALQDEVWLEHDFFRRTAEAIDADPYREKLGLPESMADLAGQMRAHFERLLQDPIAWNGLTREQNLELARSRDPVRIASLVLEGLLRVTRRRSTGRLRIELVRGSITDAQNLDAVAVSVIDGQPLGGAGAALDRAVEGRATLARAGERSLVSLESEDVDADWLYFASLGEPSEVEDLQARIHQAGGATVEIVARHGFRRIGVVAFGAALGVDVEAVTRSMLEGFAGLPETATLVWFEKDEKRYRAIKKELQAAPKVSLTTRVMEIDSVEPSPPPDDELFVHVRLRDGELTTTVIPPAGTVLADVRRTPLDEQRLESLSRGVGAGDRSTPPLDDLRERGLEIADLLFGSKAESLLDHCRDSRVTIVHDRAASRIPFELLLAEPEDGDAVRPATGRGLHRRLAVAGMPMSHLLGHPPLPGRLKLLMVVNPTCDLESTETEAKQISKILGGRSDIEIAELWHGDATVERLLETMKDADILHFGGHGFYDGPDEDQSGLLLAGHERLTLSRLRAASFPVRFAFVNSCEAGRVRAAAEAVVETEAVAFAEIFLRSGIEAYLGTYWRVGDAAAADFAASVYQALAEGRPLGESVHAARRALYEMPEKNWGNYLLYGDGRFRLTGEW